MHCTGGITETRGIPSGTSGPTPGPPTSAHTAASHTDRVSGPLNPNLSHDPNIQPQHNPISSNTHALTHKHTHGGHTRSKRPHCLPWEPWARATTPNNTNTCMRHTLETGAASATRHDTAERWQNSSTNKTVRAPTAQPLCPHAPGPAASPTLGSRPYSPRVSPRANTPPPLPPPPPTRCPPPTPPLHRAPPYRVVSK